jgi:hypothetical protein
MYVEHILAKQRGGTICWAMEYSGEEAPKYMDSSGVTSTDVL